MIATASRLFSRQGYRSTTMRGIVEAAGTPWGSVHHYWPDGKEQLGVAAVQFGDQRIRGAIAACLEQANSPGAAVAGYLSLVLSVLAGSGWEEGCPVTTVALEVTSDGTAVSEACAAAFTAWRSAWASGFRAAGISAARARELATTVVGAIEGALILSRVSRDAKPMRLAASTLQAQVDAEIPA